LDLVLLLQGGTVARSSAARVEASTAARPGKPAKPAGNAVADGTLPDFDRIIHERMRLGIVSALAVNDSLTFNELKKLLQTTDGNLSVHARRLEEAEYVTCTKSFEGRMPKTEYKLTPRGRKMFEKYLSHMEALIHAMREK
jgi:DNA-binding HxlR family transcriptional regulator